MDKSGHDTTESALAMLLRVGKSHVMSRLGRRSVLDLCVYISGWDMGKDIYSRIIEAVMPFCEDLGIPCYGIATAAFLVATDNDSDAVDLFFSYLEGMSHFPEPIGPGGNLRQGLGDFLRNSAHSPGAYFGGNSINYIWAFIAGWEDANPPEADARLIAAIKEWYRKVYASHDALSRSTWRSALLYAGCGSEERAIDIFYSQLERILDAAT